MGPTLETSASETLNRYPIYIFKSENKTINYENKQLRISASRDILLQTAF